MQQLSESFSLSGINKSPSIFDEPKLRWLSGEYIKALSDEEFLSLAEPFLQQSKTYGKYDSAKLAHILKTRVEVLSDIPSKIDFIEEFGEFDSALYFNKKMKSDENIAKQVLPLAIQTLSNLEKFENSEIYTALCEIAQNNGMKNGQVLWCVRVALTARENTPGGASEMAELLGKERSISRLEQALGFLN